MSSPYLNINTTEHSKMNLTVDSLLENDTASLKKLVAGLKSQINNRPAGLEPGYQCPQLRNDRDENIVKNNRSCTYTHESMQYGSNYSNTPIKFSTLTETQKFQQNPPISSSGSALEAQKIDTNDNTSVSSDRRKSGLSNIPSTCAFCKKNLSLNLSVLKTQIYKEASYVCKDCESLIFSAKKTSVSRNPLLSTSSSNDELCLGCKKPLENNYLNVLGDRYHFNHFVCCKCKIPLYTLGSCYPDPKQNKQYYCQRDYLLKFASNCHKCKLQITQGDMITSLGQQYHSSCFTCTVCNNPFENDMCYDNDGEPFCERHWHTKNKTICNICDGVIKDKCLIIDNVKYHYNCVV